MLTCMYMYVIYECLEKLCNIKKKRRKKTESSEEEMIGLKGLKIGRGGEVMIIYIHQSIFYKTKFRVKQQQR